MTHIARLLAVALTVSLIAHAGVAVGVGGNGSGVTIGQEATDLTDRDATTVEIHVGATDANEIGTTVEDHVDSVPRRILTHVATAAESPLPVEPVGVVACYSRYGESDPLAHPTRRALREAVAGAPGKSMTGVAREIGVPVSTARYHLRVLEGDGIVDRHRIDGNARLYPAEFDGDRELAAVLSASAPAAVVDAVRAAEPVSVTALAARTDLADSTASYHISRLTDAGALERERDGKTVRVSLSADAARLLGDAPAGDG